MAYYTNDCAYRASSDEYVLYTESYPLMRKVQRLSYVRPYGTFHKSIDYKQAFAWQFIFPVKYRQEISQLSGIKASAK